jgi:hypothetical protein
MSGWWFDTSRAKRRRLAKEIEKATHDERTHLIGLLESRCHAIADIIDGVRSVKLHLDSIPRIDKAWDMGVKYTAPAYELEDTTHKISFTEPILSVRLDNGNVLVLAPERAENLVVMNNLIVLFNDPEPPRNFMSTALAPMFRSFSHGQCITMVYNDSYMFNAEKSYKFYKMCPRDIVLKVLGCLNVISRGIYDQYAREGITVPILDVLTVHMDKFIPKLHQKIEPAVVSYKVDDALTHDQDAVYNQFMIDLDIFEEAEE